MIRLDNGHMDYYQRFLHCLEKGENDEAKSILQSDAENFCNMVDSSGSTLLHYSARYSNAVMAQHLITMGCDVNVLDNFNFTPLMLAVQNADVLTAKILLENNAHVLTKQSTLTLAFYQRMNSLISSENQQHELILQMLFEKMDEDFRLTTSDNVEQLLSTRDDLEKFAIVVFGNADLAELLLKGSFSTDFQEPTRGFTALHCTMSFARVENTKLLIKYGADITLVNYFRLSPLRYYTWNFESVDKDSNVLELCLRGNISLYLHDQWGFNVAEYLLKWGHKKTVKTVLRLGFDIIVRFNGCIDDKQLGKVAELLLQHAANNEVLTCQFFIQLSFLRRLSLLLRTIIADFVLFGTRRESQLIKLALHEIESEEMFKAYFELCIQQVEKMKSVVVYGTVTLFMLLTQRQDKLVAYARNQDLILAFKNIMMIASDMEPYYFNTLHKRVRDSIERAEFEAEVASVIKMLTGLHVDAYHAIVFNIISYLEHRDLKNLCRAGSSW